MISLLFILIPQSLPLNLSPFPHKISSFPSQKCIPFISIPISFFQFFWHFLWGCDVLILWDQRQVFINYLITVSGEVGVSITYHSFLLDFCDIRPMQSLNDKKCSLIIKHYYLILIISHWNHKCPIISLKNYNNFNVT